MASPSCSSHSDESGSSAEASTEDIPVASTSSGAGSPPAKSHHLARPPLQSCAPCRLRRVKCDRTMGESGMECLRCAKKGIQCVEVPKPAKRTLVRSGRRLEQAKAIYGKLEGKQPEGANPLDPLSPSGFTSKLLAGELEGSLISALLNDYLSSEEEPLVSATSLITSFEQCGRQLPHLDAHSKALCAAIIAVTAQTSDHPLIVGANGPPVSSLPSLALEEQDLSEFGRRRASACSVLTQQAIDLADSSGCFSRIPTLPGIAALMLLESLVQPHAISDKSLASRPYLSAYTGHIKLMMESQPPESAAFPAGVVQVLGLTALIRDALSSSMTGHSPHFTEEHLLQMHGVPQEGDSPLSLVMPLSVVMLLPRLQDNASSLWVLFDALLIETANVTTSTAFHLTSVKARNAYRLDFTFCTGFLERLETIRVATIELIARGQLYAQFGSTSQSTLGLPTDIPEYIGASLECRDMDARYLWRHIRSLRGARCLQMFILERVVQDRINARGKNQSKVFELVGGGGGIVDEHLVELLQLSERCRAAAFTASQEVVEIFEDALRCGDHIGGPGWIDAQAQEFLFTLFPQWSRYLVEAPTAEEGGPPAFDYTKKLSSLVTVKRALSAVGWSFPRFSEPLGWLQSAIDTVKLAQATYWTRLAGAAAVSDDVPMGSWTSVDFDSLLNQLIS